MINQKTMAALEAMLPLLASSKKLSKHDQIKSAYAAFTSRTGASIQFASTDAYNNYEISATICACTSSDGKVAKWDALLSIDKLTRDLGLISVPVKETTGDNLKNIYSKVENLVEALNEELAPDKSAPWFVRYLSKGGTAGGVR